MNKAKRLRVAGATVLSLWCGIAAAEDIDLFKTNPGINTPAPNVLFILDNSANWSATMGERADGSKITKTELEHQALYEVLTDPDWLGTTDGLGNYKAKYRVGMMYFAHSNNPKGGEVHWAVKDLDSAYQATIKNDLYDGGLVVVGKENLAKTNNAPYALMLNEAYRYLAGLTPMSGDVDGDHDSDAIGEDGKYISPMVEACAKNFTVLIGNGEPDSGEDNDAEAKLTALGGVLPSDPINVDPDNFEANWTDEYSRYLASIDFFPDPTFVDGVDVSAGEQNVVTYVIDVYDPDSNQKNTSKFKGARAWLQSVAGSQSRYFAAHDATDIRAALEKILNEIQAVNSVFASTTLPVSVNVRGTNLNQVYIGVFRPDAQDLPRWLGNLKLYKLAVDPATGAVFLADANDNRADSQVTGFIDSGATSYWSHDSSFWDFDPRGTPPSGSDAPDGEVVEKGGAAQQVREDFDAAKVRKLYTCTGACGSGSLLSSTLFATGNGDISIADLGVADSTERTALINWIRGEDNYEDEDDDASSVDARASAHGDVLHSRPAVINYNRDGSDNDIIVFYGANDGVFHAVDAGKEADAGHELWGFIPEEFFDRLKRLRDNDLKISTDGKPYFVDGHIGVYQKDVNNDRKLVAADGDKVYLFLSMRRGGRMLYALDVSDPETPALLWKRTPADAGWSELGQTWSDVKVARIAYDGGTDVLIMGAGYDAAAQDELPADPDTMGRTVMVVDVETGDLIWTASHADMDYSFPSGATVINRDFDLNGYADRVYIGDAGGQIWRLDIASTTLADWKVHKLADLGGSVGAGGVRKFLYAPDVVYGDTYDSILIGSGDREHPFDETVANRFYMIKDGNFVSAANKAGIVTGPITTLTEADLYDASANLIQVGTDAQRAQAQTDLQASNGWYISLNTGEKVVGTAVTLSGTVFFNTNQPSTYTADCTSNLGIARNYMLSYEDASSTINNDGVVGLTTSDRSRSVPGGGYPPSPVPVVVEIDGQKYQAVISGTQVAQAPGEKLGARRRSFWFREME